MQRQTLPSSLAAATIATNHTSPDEKLFQNLLSKRESVQYEQHEITSTEANRSDLRYDDQTEKLESMSEDDHKGTVETASGSSDLANFETQLDMDTIDTNRMSDPQLQQRVDQAFIPEQNAAIQGPAVLKHKLSHDSHEQEEIKQSLTDAIREREEFKRKAEIWFHKLEDAKRKGEEAEHKRENAERERENVERERENAERERDELKHKLEDAQKEAFNQKYVAALELVNSAQPTVMYTMHRNGGTRSATAMKPVGVMLWPNFLKEQTEFSGPRQLHFSEEKGFIPRRNNFTLGNFTLGKELSW